MIVESFVLHHPGVEDHGHTALRIIDGAERRHRTWLDPHHFTQQIRRTERKTPVGVQQPMQALEVDVGIFEGDHQINCVFLVAQKKVLRVPSGNLPAKALRLLNRKKRRMLDRRMGNAEGVERGEELIGIAGHRCNNSRSWGLLSTRLSWR
jgi:hypothetical protein